MARDQPFPISFLSCYLTTLSSVLILTLLLSRVTANCECGYIVDDTDEYFTHIIYNNFSRPAADIKDDFFQNWVIQTWNATPSSHRKSTFPVLHEEENVGIQDGSLVLRQKGYSKEDRQLRSNVSVAAIASQRTDILHGSFRTVMRVEGAKGGSVGGFFWYHVSCPPQPLIYSYLDLILIERYRTTRMKSTSNFLPKSPHQTALQLSTTLHSHP